jgi:uncharacterized protein YgbK (DUF1537 family)
MALRIGVLADDLTGALASAAALRHNGLGAVVQWEPTEPGGEVGAVVVDMRTRDRELAAERHARRWAAWLAGHGARHLELRIDSTLRGRTAPELRGLVAGAELDEPWFLAVPASPGAGRTTRDGRQLVHGGAPQDVAQRLFGEPATTIGLDVVHAGPAAVVERMTAAGSPRFVADAEHDGHLRTLALAARRLHEAGQPLVTLSPGAWLRHHPADADGGGEVVVVVLGSATEVNRQGLEVLRRHAATALLDACGAPEPDAVGPATRIVVVETIRSGDEADADRLARDAAAVAAERLAQLRDEGRHVAGVVVSGGHTAACLLELLRPSSIRPEREVAPLCPLGALVGGPWSGLPLITKGGLIGAPHTLSDLATTLAQEHPCPTRDPA